MKMNSKFVLLTAVAALTFLTNADDETSRFPALTGLQLVSEAHAIAGVRRRTRRRTAVVAYSAGSAHAAQQQQAAPAPAPAPVPAQPAGAPPLGSIVTILPDGCATKAISGVQYNDCNGVFYRTAFQGNSLVYVVSQP